ncbi:TonB-linked outer membrane protein, SusC/RagA family [Chitinophaga jiangningensis]|uniref:TonB-linked outer membrane protein, SusC/RagA family n=1 Tax=Chitinophaga jiangningensis TaxID=1419482 RepID=A0A1M7I5F1_9BACT|nr:TonB-dependent receptor [Chitinophaga jiangningensis]SHM35940.1 TonB-linked outer membrane protein, SusC/RagA family [Chitinophaga jiangningensis]
MVPRYVKAIALLCLLGSVLQPQSTRALPISPWQQVNLTIRGKVKDINGNPLPGVTVLVKDTKRGATTDEKGNFSINDVKKESVLVFQFIGYDPVEQVVDGKPLSIVLKESQKTLDEYVVVGYGTQKKVTKTGAVSMVKGSELQQSPNVNISNSLVGRIPGIIAVNQSGEPGYDGSRIFIRGRSTLGNSNPLVVIDGFPRDGFERMNPNDIESVSILKDAAAAIYGSRAANGVILVTTKRGKGGKPSVSYGYNQSFVTPTRLPKMADAPTYAQIVNEILTYGGDAPRYTDEQIKKFGDGSDPWLYPNTNWYDATIKKVSLQNRHDLSLSGGTEKMSYYVSLGSLFQDGIYKNSATNYKQQNVRANLDAVVNEYIRLRFDLAGRLEDRNFPPRSAGSIFRALMRGRPTENAIWPTGEPGPDIEYGDNPVVTGTNAIGYTSDKNYVVNGTFVAVVNIPWVQGLFVDGSFAYDQNFQFGKTFVKPWTLYTLDPNSTNHALIPGSRGVSAPELTENFNTGRSSTVNLKLNYTRTFGKHYVSAFAAFEQNSLRGDNFGAYRRFFVSDKLDQLSAGGDKQKDNNGSAFEYARRNYFGRISYNYKETYLFDFNGRYDGTQNFPEGRRMGFFPGASAGWVLSNENFWKENIHAMSYFKIRGSWGQMGNDNVPPFQYLTTYGFAGGGVMFGSDLNKSIYQIRTPNPYITWEVANNYNIGLETKLFKDKLSIEGEYFYSKRSNILIPRNAAIPDFTGLTLPDENIGIVSNKGFEMVLSHKNDIKKFHYEIIGTVTRAKNKILYWAESPNVPAWQQYTGGQIEAPLYYKAVGIYHTQDEVDKSVHLSGARPGDVIFADINNDKKIDDLDRIRVDKTQYPTMIYGLTMTAKYANFDFTMLWQAATGASQYIRTESGLIGNFPEAIVKDRWTAQNPNGSWPRAYDRDREYWVNRQNTFWYWNTNYARLKTLDFGYNVPGALCKRIGIQNFRVYFTGQNLLTIDNVKIFDPEAPQGSGQYYPQTKIYNVGLNVTF